MRMGNWRRLQAEAPWRYPADEMTDRLTAVAPEIVDDDDVIRTQRRQQRLPDMQTEPLAIDRASDQPGCFDTPADKHDTRMVPLLSTTRSHVRTQFLVAQSLAVTTT
jgi:hypothetical protein